MELAFLGEFGLLERRITTGAIQTLPLALQHIAGAQLVEYLAIDTAARLKQSIRCDEDLRYLIETIGCVFAFSASEFGGTIRKALDIYSIIMNPPLVDALAPFQGPQRETFLTDMLRHTTQLFAPRSDYPAANATHMVLIGRLLNQVSIFATAHEGKLSNDAWFIIIRAIFGSLNFCCLGAQTFPEMRSAVSSVALEVLIRSKVTDAAFWMDVVRLFVPKGYATVAQWGTFVVALTRSVACLLSDRPLPNAVHARFKGMPDNVRNEVKLVDYTPNEVVFVWKKLLVVFGELHSLQDEDALCSASHTLRDVVVLVGCATYWRRDVAAADAMFDFRKPHPAAEKLLPPNPTTDSLIALAANNVMLIALRKSPDGSNSPSSTLNRAKAWAVEALCAIFLRRETEAACNPRYLDAFFNTIVSLASEEPMWATLLQNTVSLYLLNIPIPQDALSALASVVCSIFFSEEAWQGDESDEDLADDDNPADEALKQKIAVLECAAHHAAGLFALASVTNERGVLASLTAAVLCGIEKHSRSTKLLHQLLCTVTLCVAQRPRCIVEDEATFTDITENAMALLRAPFGTYPVDTLRMAVDFLAWFPPIKPSITVTIVVSLCTFCQSTRRLEGQVDGSELGALFETTCRALGRIINKNHEILQNDAVALSILRVVDTGCKPLLQPEVFSMRDSAMWLFNVFTAAFGWPHVDQSTDISYGPTEADFAARAAMIKIFEVNGARIVTVLELLPSESGGGAGQQPAAGSAAASAAAGAAAATVTAETHIQPENEVVLIVRDAFARRVFRFKRHVIAAAVPDPLLPIPRAADCERYPLSVPLDVTDALRFVHMEPRTAQLLERWGQEASIRELLAHCDSQPEEALSETAFERLFRHTVVADPTAMASRLARCLFGDLGMVSARTHELPFDEELVAALKGLDELECRDAVDIAVVFVGDDADVVHDSASFKRFVDALGWERRGGGAADVASGTRHHCTLQDRITFHPVIKTARAFVAEERAADESCTRTGADEARVRILWDATEARLNWAASQQPLHDHLASVAPQFRAVETRRFFDIVVTPLLKVGLYSVRLRYPRGLSRQKQVPWLWGAPLLHGALLAADALPTLVRKAAHHAALQRDKAIGAYVSPMLMRRQAIRKVLAGREAVAAHDALPTQSLVSLLDAANPKRATASASHPATAQQVAEGTPPQSTIDGSTSTLKEESLTPPSLGSVAVAASA